MAVRIVRLGSPRGKGEGLRIGAVRRPPRGVPKAEFASRDFYDVWLPTLSPSPELFTKARAAKHDARLWNAFVRRFKAEMKTPGAGHVLDLLAALSRTADFSLGCYCTDERCHRFVLQSLLRERGARMAP